MGNLIDIYRYGAVNELYAFRKKSKSDYCNRHTIKNDEHNKNK